MTRGLFAWPLTDSLQNACFLYMKVMFISNMYICSLKILMVIAICATKEEYVEAQILFWNSLNNVLQEEGFPAADFARFMVDEARAHWITIRTMFNGSPYNVLEG